MTSRPAYVAVSQFSPSSGLVEQNVSSISQMIEAIKNEQSQIDLVVFPECCLYGYDQLDESINLDHQAVLRNAIDRLRILAVKYQVNLIVGYPYFNMSSGKLFNRIIYLGRDSKTYCIYDKTHLIPYDRNYFTMGDKYVLLKTDIGIIGFLICWDLCFPEVSTLYASYGANIVVAPSAWEEPFIHQFEVMTEARAIENGIYLLVANQSGQDTHNHYFGGSRIITPTGNILSRTTGNGNSWVIHRIEIDQDHHRGNPDFGLPLLDRRLDLKGSDHLKMIKGGH